MKINNSTKKSLLIIALAMAEHYLPDTARSDQRHRGNKHTSSLFQEMELARRRITTSMYALHGVPGSPSPLDGNQHHRRRSIRQPLTAGSSSSVSTTEEYGLDYATFLHLFFHQKFSGNQTTSGVPTRGVMERCGDLRSMSTHPLPGGTNTQ